MKYLIESWLPAPGTVLNAIWQGILLTALVWVLLVVLRRLNAASRFAIWWAALLAVACLPLAQGLWTAGRSWTASSRLQNARAAVEKARQQGPQAEARAVAELEACLDSAPAPSVKPFVRMLFPFSPDLKGGTLANWLGAIWALGTAIMITRLGWGFLQLRRVKRDGAPLPGASEETFAQCQLAGAPGRLARVRSSSIISSPIAVGFRHPVVILPQDLSARLTNEEFKQVCLHELAHLQRRDDWTNLAQQFVRALLWFHPAVQWISRRLALEREIACDDLVIGATAQVKPYALCLTRLAELVRLPNRFELAPGASLNRTQLSRRIDLLLDRQRDTSPRLARARIMAAVALLAAGLFVSLELSPVVAHADSLSTQTTPAPADTQTAPPSPVTSTATNDVPVFTFQANLPPVPFDPQPVVSPVPPPGRQLLVWDSPLKEQTVKPGAASAEFVFWVTNVSSSNVTIDGLHTSCGCTVAKAPATPWTLAPHTHDKVEVSVNLAGKSGIIIKQVTVISSNAPQLLNVKITIPDATGDRARNQQMATADPRAIFNNDCARCHVEPARGKMGADLYTAACGVCHEAAHRATMVPDLHTLNHPTNYAFWKEMIHNGKPNTMMPGFSVANGGPLTDEQVESLAQLLTKGVPKPVLVPVSALNH